MVCICPNCGEVNPDYRMIRHEDNSPEYGSSAWYSCPDCGEEFPNLEEYGADECPVCHTGYRFRDFPVCLKCALRAEDKLRRFLQEFTAEELEVMDIMIEGDCLDEFAKGDKPYAIKAFFGTL